MMSCCENCERRTPTCHADCAEYLAERVLAAHEGRDRIEREVASYEAESLERGGRRKSGQKVYKSSSSHWWRNRRINTGR